MSFGDVNKWNPLFDEMDTDHDGWISLAEFEMIRAIRPELREEYDYIKVQKFFEYIDSNYGDGNRLFDRQEFANAMHLIEMNASDLKEEEEEEGENPAKKEEKK